LEKIEAEERKLADDIRFNPSSTVVGENAAFYDGFARQLENDFVDLMQHHIKRLRGIAAQPALLVPHCIYLQQRSYSAPGGEVFACCKPDIGPMGNALETSWLSVYNGHLRRKVLEGFFNGQPPKPCLKCEYNSPATVRYLLHRAFPEGFSLISHPSKNT